MGIYSGAIAISSGALFAIPLCDVESSAIESPVLLAIDFSIRPTSGNILRIGMGRSSNTPASVSSTAFVAEELNDPACTSVIATAWSTAPMAPANFYRTFGAIGNVASNFLFTFPTGLRLASSSSFGAWATTVTAAGLINIGWEIEI